MNIEKTKSFVEGLWDSSITQQLENYIKIPNKSPFYDVDWEKNGYMDDAVKLVTDWLEANGPSDMQYEVIKLPERTPLIFIEIPGTIDKTVLLYGHLDKQPEMTGWREDLGPWKPLIEDDKLYGRGGADDGYAVFSAVTAIQALRQQDIPHDRCVIIIECCEESGSYDLPPYVEHLSDRIGTPELVICLDSGCGNYDQMWMTTSLRGMVAGDLSVEIIREGVHSGLASGIVPSTFRIVRELLSRIEDEKTGKMALSECEVAIPKERVEQASIAAEVLGDDIFLELPLIDGAHPSTNDLKELLLNRTWRSTLCVTGVDGLPPLRDAGNVLRPKTTLKLSIRIPPTADPNAATVAIKNTLEANPPYGAKVTFEPEPSASGWHAPILPEWLAEVVDHASKHYFGAPACYMGEGGTIPFMGMLGDMFPDAQFVITGVLGPRSNAHGPNEFLHLPTAKKLTCCIAHILMEHGKRT